MAQCVRRKARGCFGSGSVALKELLKLGFYVNVFQQAQNHESPSLVVIAETKEREMGHWSAFGSRAARA